MTTRAPPAVRTQTAQRNGGIADAEIMGGAIIMERMISLRKRSVQITPTNGNGGKGNAWQRKVSNL
jgi:hypothetical protein